MLPHHGGVGALLLPYVYKGLSVGSEVILLHYLVNGKALEHVGHNAPEHFPVVVLKDLVYLRVGKYVFFIQCVELIAHILQLLVYLALVELGKAGLRKAHLVHGGIGGQHHRQQRKGQQSYHHRLFELCAFDELFRYHESGKACEYHVNRKVAGLGAVGQEHQQRQGRHQYIHQEFFRLHCAEDGEGRQGYNYHAVGAAVVVYDPAAYTQTVAVGDVGGAGNPGQADGSCGDGGGKEEAPVGLISCLLVSYAMDKAHRQNRHLGGLGRIGDVKAHAHIAYTHAVEYMQQADSSNGSHGQDEGFFLLQGKKEIQGQQQHYHQSDNSRHGALGIFCPVGQNIQHRLKDNKQHEPVVLDVISY